MDYMDKDFGKILKNNAQTLRHELLAAGTDCFRVYDRNLSRYPVTVDLYGRYAKVTDFGPEPMDDATRATCLDICSRMLYLDAQNVIYAYRARRPDRAQHEKTGSDAVITTVSENGLKFRVDLTTYVDTGLFLDHAVTRALIRERSANADVLNLFSYTGSFSVYAAAGFANTVTSVDLSTTYTNWAEANLSANGYSGDMYRCICMDAAKFVQEAIGKGLKYDIIIFDPPSFSNSHKMDGDFDVARDYAQWVRDLLKILKRTGFILFSTNLGTFRMDRRKLRGLSVKEITGLVAAPGFVKDRAGTVRSWMMAFDDDSLSLDWSEPEKKSVKGSDNGERKERTSSERSGYRRDGRDYRKDDRRDARRDGKRSYGRENREGREYGSRDGREGRENRDYSRGERSYSRDDRSYSRDDRRDYRREGHDGREDRYSDRRSSGRYEDRGNRYERDDRRDDRRDGQHYAARNSGRYGEHGDKGYERKQYGRSYDKPYEKTYGKSYDKPYDRGDRPERKPYDRTDRADRADRTDRADRPARTERSYDEQKPYRSSDRSDRPYEKKSYDRKPYEKKQYSDSRRKGGSSKPYGYDSFKPARSREDSTDFFWNAEDLDPKKRNSDD